MESDEDGVVRHRPYLLFAGRHGSWCECTCGEWRSRIYTSVTGAHLEFGQHLVDEARKHQLEGFG
jgi:hypothetical protein